MYIVVCSFLLFLFVIVLFFFPLFTASGRYLHLFSHNALSSSPPHTMLCRIALLIGGIRTHNNSADSQYHITMALKLDEETPYLYSFLFWDYLHLSHQKHLHIYDFHDIHFAACMHINWKVIICSYVIVTKSDLSLCLQTKLMLCYSYIVFPLLRCILYKTDTNRTLILDKQEP